MSENKKLDQDEIDKDNNEVKEVENRPSGQLVLYKRFLYNPWNWLKAIIKDWPELTKFIALVLLTLWSYLNAKSGLSLAMTGFGLMSISHFSHTWIKYNRASDMESRMSQCEDDIKKLSEDSN